MGVNELFGLKKKRIEGPLRERPSTQTKVSIGHSLSTTCIDTYELSTFLPSNAHIIVKDLFLYLPFITLMIMSE